MARGQHEHAQPQGVALKAGGAGDGLFGDAPATKSEWLDMPPPPEPGKYGAFPYDHAPVLITADGETGIVAQWRTTREMNRKTLRWDDVGFWTERNTGGRRLERLVDGVMVPFEALGYRRVEE